MAKKPQQHISKPVTSERVVVPPAPASAGKWSAQAKMAILLAVISCLVYFNTLNNKYVLDDFTVIKSNTIVTRGAKAIGEIFATPYRHGWFITTNDLYRPMSLAMFAVEWDAGGGSPVPFHLMNILLFAGAVVLLFYFFDGLMKGKKTVVALIAALLFAVHPIHTEVIANIKSRDELLCFFFAFASLNLFLKYAEVGKMQQLIGGAICFFLSFLSKETVVTFLAIIPLIFFFYRKDNIVRSLSITVSAAVVTGLFLGIRYAVLTKYNANADSHVTFMDNMLSLAPNPMSRLATEVLILGNYIKLLFVPYPLVSDYCYNSIPFATFGNVWVLLSFAFYLFLGVFGLYRLVKHPADPYAFGILFFLVTISLFSNIPFLIGSPMAERFVFFASAGFCFIAALLIERFLMAGEATLATLKSGKVLAVIVPVCAIYAIIAVDRNKDWLDNLTLFRADVVHGGNDARLNYYLGTELVTETLPHEGNPVVKKEIMDEGMTHLKKALEIYPLYDDAHAAIGDAYFKIVTDPAMPGNATYKAALLDSAEAHDKRALELNPKFIVAMNNLAGVYFVKNRIDLSIEYCRKSLVLNPTYVNTYSNLGLCYLHLSKFDSSLINLHKAIAIDPKYVSAYDNMVLTFNAMNRRDSAAYYANIAKELRTN